MKHLDGKGKGEMDYDYKNDILVFKIKDREYKKSIDFEDIILDLDKEGFITGVQIFDASKLFKMNKAALKNIKKWEFNTKVEDKNIIVQLTFEALQRNKVLVKGTENIRREAQSPLAPREALCTINA